MTILMWAMVTLGWILAGLAVTWIFGGGARLGRGEYDLDRAMARREDRR